jgi:hypothetical protein
LSLSRAILFLLSPDSFPKTFGALLHRKGDLGQQQAVTPTADVATFHQKEAPFALAPAFFLFFGIRPGVETPQRRPLGPNKGGQ